MPDTPDQLSSVDGAIEYRDPRFAELDSQIEANKEPTRKTPSEPKRKRRHATGPRLPAAVREEIARFARELRPQHPKLFVADPKLKDRAARLLRSWIPPQRKRGRPGLGSVTAAIHLRQQLRRLFPCEPWAKIWERIYPQAITGYDAMTDIEQNDARQELRERVRWRQRATRSKPGSEIRPLRIGH